MTQTTQTAPPSPSAEKLDKTMVLQAIAATCDAARPVEKQLRKGVRRLLSSSRWAQDVSRLERAGLIARHFEGPLCEVFNFAGELILLRASDASFRLLQCSEQRWQYLTRDGSPLSLEVNLQGQVRVEAVILKRPPVDEKMGGMTSLKALWPALRGAWAEVGLASLYINAGQLLLPLFALLIYDKVAQNGLFETLWAMVFGMLLYLITDAGMRLVRSWATERIGTDLAQRGDEKLWARLMAQVDLPPGGFPRFLSHYRDLALSRDFVSSSYLLAIADLPFLLLYLAVIGMIAWPLMLVALALVLIFSLAGCVLQARLTRMSYAAEQANTLKLSYMGETLNSLDVVRTSPGGGVFLRNWRELTEKSTRADAGKRLAVQQMSLLSLLLQTLTTVVILTSGVYLIHAQLLSVGMLIACNLLANRAMGLVASLFAVVSKWQDFKRSAARMETSLEDIKTQVCTPRPRIDGHIRVVGLSKGYVGRPPALDGVSFVTQPGERIALLGRPGAGKSTLLQCLAGLCRPDAGQILIDGLALNDISRFDRVKWLACKSQDPVVFAGTLEENLRISGVASNRRYAEAIWASGLEDEFKSGRMSLGMSLTERGSNLSGGQRQKVALARAFAQTSRILLLDEPTLGLDPESERLLAERLPQLVETSTQIIMTTHSPVLLEMVQRIIVLEAGRLVADGPREKLVNLPTRKSFAVADTAKTA